MASGHGHGSMSLSMKFIRLLIVLFNFAFIVVGLIILAIGVYLFKDPKMQQLRPILNPDIISSYSQSLSTLELFAIALIVIGGVLLIIGFLGKNISIFMDLQKSNLFSISIFSRLLWSNKRFSVFTCPLCIHYRRNNSCGNRNNYCVHCLPKQIPNRTCF